MAIAMSLGVVASTPARADDLDEATPVEVDEPAITAPGTTPPTPTPEVTTHAERSKTGSFAIGAGFNPDDGFVFGARIAQDDLFHTGQQLVLSAELSQIRQDFSLAHVLPIGGFELRSELLASARDFGSFGRESVGGALTLGRQLTPSTRIYARYRIEEVTVEPSGLAMTRAPGMAALLGNGNFATLGAGVVYDTRDALALPRHGTRLELFGERADRQWGSDYSLDRVGVVGEHARDLGPFTLRLAGRATYVRSRDGMAVPLAYRLQHLGHADVRGFEIGSFGGVGGNIEAIGRAELELPVWKRAGLSLAGFHDMGMQQNTDAAWGDTDAIVRRSIGASLIWRSPIGPLRLDVAYPLDGYGPRQFLFTVGGGF
ncbi:MAG TPA: BamA/TamA family outer membrane protein [Kofleriaceae bacterium]|nr:BamA/TamA family outer membrane protein [Kofleriaceae bacterium]